MWKLSFSLTASGTVPCWWRRGSTAATERPPSHAVLTCEPFLCSLRLQVKKQPCLFEHWRWTIFSHWDSGTSAVLDFESSAESCRDSIPTPLSLYGTRWDPSVQCICCSVAPCPPPACLTLCPALCLPSRPLLPAEGSTFTSPSLMWPCSCDAVQREHHGAPCSSLDCLWVTHTHTQNTTNCAHQQPDLLENIDWCPYIGSFIGEKLDTGLM